MSSSEKTQESLQSPVQNPRQFFFYDLFCQKWFLVLFCKGNGEGDDMPASPESVGLVCDRGEIVPENDPFRAGTEGNGIPVFAVDGNKVAGQKCFQALFVDLFRRLVDVDQCGVQERDQPEPVETIDRQGAGPLVECCDDLGQCSFPVGACADPPLGLLITGIPQ